jgi:CheY-like chemotaxis protein
VRTAITEVLGELGYAAIGVSDDASGFKVLQSDVRIDLLITDAGLSGGMNGRQMADAARLSPHLPVLFISGYAESVAIGKRALAPAMHLMAKPFAMEMLIRPLSRESGSRLCSMGFPFLLDRPIGHLCVWIVSFRDAPST